MEQLVKEIAEEAPENEAAAQAATSATVEAAVGSNRRYSSFPYEAPSEHWNVDFANSHEVYEGAELPVWILAGWAVFIIWAIIYLTAGARTTF